MKSSLVLIVALNALTACQKDDDAKATPRATTGATTTTATGATTTGNGAATTGSGAATTGNGAATTADGTAASDDGTQAPGATTGGGGTTGTDVADHGSASAAHWFGPTMFFNQSIEAAAKDAESDALIASLQAAGWGTGKFRIDFSLDVLFAAADTPRAPTAIADPTFVDNDQPADVPVAAAGSAGFESSQGTTCDGGDCHYLVLDGARRKLYEGFQASVADGKLQIPQNGALVEWDTQKAYPASLRGDVCTSADAGGLPIAPLLFSAEELAAGEVTHAIRFILPNTRIQCRQYVRPATHGTGPQNCAGWATSQGMPYGARLRLRADFPVASLPSAGARVVARGLQKYGMILADGGNIALTAKSDATSAQKYGDLIGTHDLNTILPRDFEMVEAGARFDFTSFDCTRTP